MLNIHEDVGAKPSSWVVVAWLPVLAKEKSFRPWQGYEVDAARNLSIYHECWRLFLAKFNEDSKNARVVLFSDGNPVMATGKNHSIQHTPGDVARCCDAINVSCEAPETAHKKWVKEQGVCTNQGEQVQLSMMLHSFHKEASSFVCEGVQGNQIYVCTLHIFVILFI